ncbi:MAG TPA: GEVED domain-containing protein, partial [Bacteroidales bacterium]|nr:GEVED domain-containing protein [Bacteroidales bacterium]
SPYAPPASGTGNFVLEISTDFGNTWSEIETVSNNGVAGWQTKAYDLSTYVNTGDFLKFRITANWISGDYCIGFDNFNLASCLPVSDLSASNITNASATISWTASGSNPDDYQVYVSLANIAPAEDETNIEISNTNSIDLTGLEDSPLHYVWVRSDCGAGDISEWVGPLALWTSCEPIVALPYTENFDAYGTGTTAFPNCWSKPETYNSYPYIVDAYSVSSPASLRFNSSTTTPTYAVSPAFAEDIQNLRVSFQLRAESTTYSGTIELGVMSDPNDISTFESVATIQPTNTSFNYYYYDLYLATLSGANNYIALRHNATSTSYYYWLDDFKVELSPSCLEPANFEASNINTTSVSLSWTALPTAPENGYDIYVSETETAPTELSAPTHNTAEALINIEGLTSATVYYAWLRANCNNSDVGEWTGPITFTTLCPPIATLSYTENFDSYSVGNFPDCWLRPVTYNGFPSIVSGSSYSVSSPNGLKFQSSTTTPTYAVSPAFAEDIHNLRVSFQLKAESTTYSGTIELGVMSDPNDISTFESVAIIQPENTSFNAYQYDLYSTTLSGANNHIALRHNSNSSSWYYWLDDFEVDLSPTCIEPNGFAVNSVTANSASISWTESITLPENGYDIYFSTTATAPTGSSTPTHNTNETSFLFENLDESTSYYVWVRANCNNADQSDWTGPLHIYTGYCIPTNTSTSYWISSLTTTGGITNISHTGITSQPGGYGDFSAIHSCSNVEGQPTMINFAQNTGTGYYFCWIDWNKDMQFDATERIIAATSSYSSTYQGTINIPAGTEPGEYRMRVANSYLYEITDACTGSGYGQYFDYTFVVVEPANNETDILTYSFAEQIAPATIDNVEHKVYVTVAAGTNLNGLVATFTLSEGASATVAGLPQQSGVTPNNFTYPVVYKVVAENGLDEQPWQVFVDVDDTGLSSEADILAYTIPNQVGLTSINSTNRTVALTVPYGTDLTALVATFTLSNGATAEVETVTQQSGVTPNNFTNPVTYTVTAENGTTTKNWTVTVTEAPASDQADILSYVIPNQVGLTSINSTNKTVALTVPYGTDVTALVATFTLSNGATAEVETVTQQSGVTPNNFTNPVTYTVTAQNGTTTKDWIVTVTVAGEPLSSEADILTFSFAEQFEEAIINNVNRTVNIKVNEGTNLTNLVATFTLSEGAIAKVAGLVQQSGVTPNNFTNIVIYSVTAEDGTTVKNWAVNVSEHSGIEDIEISKLSIYPNPNNGRFTLDFSDIYGKVNYQIYDTKGSIILSDNLVVNGNAMKEVSLNIAPGVYYVKLITETQSIIEKLVVE